MKHMRCWAVTPGSCSAIPVHRVGGDSCKNYVNSKHGRSGKASKGMFAQSAPLPKGIMAVTGWFCLGTAGKELVTKHSYMGAQQEAFEMPVWVHVLL